MLESQIQHKIIKYLCIINAVAVKVDASRPGWPDLTVVLTCGTVLFLEVKQPTGRLSAAQKRVHSNLARNNAHVYTVRSVSDVEAIVSRFSA